MRQDSRSMSSLWASWIMAISQIVPSTLGMLLTGEFSRLIVSLPSVSLALRCRAFTIGTVEHGEQCPGMNVFEPMDEAREGRVIVVVGDWKSV